MGERFVEPDAYFRTSASAGSNLFRAGFGNCGPQLYEEVSLMLEALQAARRHGFRVQLSLFVAGRRELTGVVAALRAADYVLALYVPLVDILEVADEARPSLVVMAAVRRRARLCAPHLLVTTSWNDSICARWYDLNAPHYSGEEGPTGQRG